MRKFSQTPLGVPSNPIQVMKDAMNLRWRIKFPDRQFAGLFNQSLLPKDIAIKEMITIIWAF